MRSGEPSDRRGWLQATPSPHLEADRQEIQAYLAQHPWCRILWMVIGFNEQIGLDVALFERYMLSLRSPQFGCVTLREIDDIDAFLDALRGRLPTVAVLYYNKPVQMDVPQDDRTSELYLRRDRFLKFERLYRFFSEAGVPILMETGDMHSRLGSDHFYSEIQRYNVTGVVTHNHGSIAPLREELAARGITAVRTFVWQPLGMDPEFHRDYGLPRRHNVLMYGRTDERFRTRLHRYCVWKQWSTFGRFGYHKLERNRAPMQATFVGHAALYRHINASRTVLVAHQSRDTHRGHPIAMTYSKYFEVPACRTVVVGQPTQDFPLLGFREDENFIAIRPDNYRAVLRRVHRDIDAPYMQELAERGYRLVHERHRISQHVNGALRDIVSACAPAPPLAAARGQQG